MSDIIDMVQGPDGVYVADFTQKMPKRKRSVSKRERMVAPAKMKLHKGHAKVIQSQNDPGNFSEPQVTVVDELLYGFDIGMKIIERIKRFR